MYQIYPCLSCWRCGRVISKGLFCDNNGKCKSQYYKMRAEGTYGRGGHAVRNGKKDGYGLSGSTH